MGANLEVDLPDDYIQYLKPEEHSLSNTDRNRLYFMRKARNELVNPDEVIGDNPGFTIEKKAPSLDEVRIILGKTYELILKVFDEYADMPPNTKKILAIWSIGTYFHEQFSAYPYLILNAMRGSGKSRLLRILSSIGNRGDGSVMNSLTEAMIFRHERNKILCLDEVENINSKDKQALRQLLNSAYKKGTKVIRMKKVKRNGEEKQEAESFEPYFPICMASIKSVEEVLSDRSITEIIEKSFNPAIVKKIENFDTNNDIKTIKTNLSDVGDMTLWDRDIYNRWNIYVQNKYTLVTNDIYIYTSYNVTNVTNILEEELFRKIDEANILGRNLELMLPLFFIAKAISDELLNEIIEIAKGRVEEKKEDEYQNSKDVSVYQFVSGLEMKVEYIVKNLVNHFRLFIGDDDSEDLWLNERWFGHALKRLGLVVVKRRANNARYVVLDVSKAIEMSKNFKGDSK